MGWFDNQLKKRHDNDVNSLNDACRGLASVINKSNTDKNRKYENALREICAYYKIKAGKIPSGIEDLNQKMDYVFKPSGVMRRRVTLYGKWWKDIDGVLLCELKNGGVVALIPGSMGNYTFYDHENGIKYKLNKKTAELLEHEAVVFYEPLPQRQLKAHDIYKYILKSITKKDIVQFMISSVAITLLGLIMPVATSLLFEMIAPSGNYVFLLTIGFMLLGVAVAKFMFSALKSGYMARMEQKIKSRLRTAVFARVLTLNADFFKKYSSGEIAKRVTAAEQLATVCSSILFETGLTIFMSVIYLVQIFTISHTMLLPVIIIILIQLIVGILTVVFSVRNCRKSLNAETELSGVVFSLFSGIQKIKVSGSEARAYKKWADSYEKKAKATYDRPFLLKISAAVTPAVSVLGMFLIYSFAYGNISVSEYVTFNTSYAMVETTLMTLVSSMTVLSMVKPIMELINPILSEIPETRNDNEVVKSISGNIELSNVSFKYTNDGPLILDDINLKIRKGQYVAIVGTTGCGKSTLMRLMLGFEKPQVGAVYYDRLNLNKIDINSLRKHIGVVLQNGKLMSDDIFSNIAISAPGLTMTQAWEAAETAGVADDIRNMPMGMNTIISEGGGGISGGQRQRLLIARAIAHKPSVLMLDEATSALDNLTQKKVSDSLDKMKCTRIVIAHRLSTIKQCDRIIVLDKGKIIEDGTYEELYKAGGFFTKLVERQQIDGK